jgi:phosphodiesterase/alkaline phosphatase D-like protein
MTGPLRSRIAAVVCLFAFAAVPSFCCGEPPELHLGSGAKAGEITDTSAIVHVRLTAIPEQNDQGLIPGRAGQARLQLRTPGADSTTSTDWQTVTADEDFSTQFRLTDLTPGQRHEYVVEYRWNASASSQRSEPFTFVTAPPPGQRATVKFQVTTGQDYRGAGTYLAMAAQQPDFLVSTGDNVYYDGPPKARDVQGAYGAYQQMYGLPPMKDFFRHVGGYFEKDDHDYRFNDADRWQQFKGGDGGRRSRKSTATAEKWLTHEQGVQVFRQVFPMSDPTYRTFRWGQGLQIWLTEGRDFRSPNSMPDGPEKTLWGRDQRDWLKRTLLESNADWRVLISPTPIIGPDRVTKTDNHANPRGFWTEGQAFLDWVRDQRLDNLVLVCGDRHWQYHALDQRHGRQIHEFSCGPTCDEHTQSVPPIEDVFRGITRPYAASKGGFLTVTYSPDGGLVYEFFDASGNGLYRHEFSRSS